MREPLVYEPTSEMVARAVVVAGAYFLAKDMSDKTQWYRWKSDVLAPVYLDLRTLGSDPGATTLIAKAMASSIRATLPQVECVVGMAEAGVVWSSLVAQELGKPHAWVRKAPKEHGLGRWIGGYPRVGSRAVLVDDLVASGGSLQHAVASLAAEKKIETVGIQTIVNWNFREMRERFGELGVPASTLVSYPQILDAALNAGLLTLKGQAELNRFYRNPREHHWNPQAFRKAA